MSEILKRKDPVVVAKATEYAAIYRQFTFTAVSVHEITYGLTAKNASRQLEVAHAAFNSNDVVVPILSDYEMAGRVRGIARANGQQLALDDCLIAVCAHRLGVPVVTGNSQHFAAIQTTGLTVIVQNWRTD